MSNVIVTTQTNKNIVVTTAGDVINVTVRNGVPLPFPSPGPQGEKGDKGDKGDTGEQGIQGPQGNPAIVNGKTGENITLDKSDIGLGNVDNTSDADKPLSTAIQAALSGKAALVHTHIISDVTGLQMALDAKQGAYSYTPEDAALKQNSLTAPDSAHYPTTQAVAGALATKADLVNGKVPLAQINDALIGNVHYKGLYSFTTGVITSDDVTLNSQPLPAAASANAGWYFIAQDSGTITGTGFILGDWIISNGASGWHKVDNTDAVSSVNGYTGNVSLSKSDVGLSNVPNTDATNPANTVQTATYRFVSDAEKATWNSKQAPATTLAGYGITDAVDLYNPQTVTGIKTWASGVNSVAIGPNKMYVQVTDDVHINSVSDIYLNCFTLHINGNNGILSSQSISFQAGKGLSFVNNSGGYTDLLPSASPVAVGYTVRMPNASGIIALQSDIPTGLPPTGTAGGDLSGSFPNPTVARLNNQLPGYYLDRANHTGVQAWGTITGTPTSLAGYGIADAYPLTGNPSGFLTSGSSLAWNKLTGQPTTLGGYGITDAYPLSGNPSGFLTSVPDLSGIYDTLATNQAISGLKTYTNGIVNTSASAGLTHYNTADQVTNYEKIIAQWQSNVFTIGSYFGGTGNSRSIAIGTHPTSGVLTLASGRVFTINPNASSAAGIFDFTPVSTAATPSVITMQGTGTAAAGTQNWLAIQPTINQSGTAAYNALYIAPYEQAIGSGSRYLINAGTTTAASGGGTFTSQFNVTSTGRVGIGTTNSSSRVLISTGVIQNAWTTTGAMFAVTSSNCTDNSTTAGTTITGPIVLNSFNNGTITASNATSGSNVTYTSAATLYITGAPSAGTNTIITNPFSLYIAGGTSIFSGPVTIGGVTSGQASWLKVGTSASKSYWGAQGIALATATSQTYTDTSSSGTVSLVTINNIGSSTIAASNATTYTNASTLYIDAAPTAGTNVTFSNPYALYVAAGISAFAGGFNTGNSYGSNIYAFSGGNAINGIANTQALFGGASSVTTRVALLGSTSNALSIGTSYSNLLVTSSPITTAASGTHAVLANAVINPLGTVTAGGATITTTASLYINGASSSGSINTALYSVSGNNYFGGNIGIGTFNPSQGLSIVSSGASSAAFLRSASTGSIVLGQALGQNWFGGYNATTSAEMQTARIRGYATENWTAGSAQGTGLGFSVTKNTTTIVSEALFINHNGFVGINTGTTASTLLHIGGSYSASSWGAGGIAFRTDTGIYTDTTSTGTNGTVTSINSFLTPTIAASNATTYTNAATVYISGAPNAGTNVGITNPWSFYINSGNAFFGGTSTLIGNGTIQGNARLSISSGITGPNTTSIGVHLAVSTNTYVDNSTAASGTATWAAQTSFGGPIFAATNTGVTYTNAATVIIQGPPVAGANAAITNPWALYVNSGATAINGNVGLNVGSLPTAQLHIGGSYSSAAWGNLGVKLKIDGTSITDTSSSGTVATAMVNTVGTPTLTASNATTYTNTATLYIQSAPVASTNVTITNTYALYVASGNSFFSGNIVTNGTLASNANITASTGITSNRAAIAATSTDGFTIQNNTAATSGAQVQYSPRIKFSGQAWNTTSLASQTATFIQEVQPAAGNPVTANLVFSSQINAGTVTAVTTLSDTGTLTTVQHGWKSLSTDPSTSNIAAGTYQVYKNTATGTVKLWVNDGGTLKSVTLT